MLVFPAYKIHIDPICALLIWLLRFYGPCDLLENRHPPDNQTQTRL